MKFVFIFPSFLLLLLHYTIQDRQRN